MRLVCRHLLNILLLLPGVLIAQTPDGDAIDRRLAEFSKAYDVVLSYRLLLPDRETTYLLIARDKDSLSAYQWDGRSTPVMRSELSPDRLSFAWKTFVQNDLFTISDEKDIPNFCADKYKIESTHAYEFRIISAGESRTLTYYDPEYYDVACYGMDERQKVINSAAVINYLNNTTSQKAAASF